MINKRKKNTRMRGKKTYGYGSKKKHRGAGNRGGRGMAGTGKRADQKKPGILKIYGREYFGRRGFTYRGFSAKKEENIINIKDLNSFSSIDVNLKELGYDKLLGSGNLDKKFNVVVASASKKAIEKVKEKGGEITLG